MTGKRPPDVIGVGCQRCATSWLHACLNSHPGIGKYPDGGLHFFSEHYDKGTGWYLEQLGQYADRPILMEFSVSYSYPEYYRETARRIHDLAPEAKLFILVRNPVERAFSDYLRSVRLLEIQKDVTFAEGIDRHPVLLERGLYGRIISRYLELFQRKQLLVMFYDDLEVNSAGFVNRLLDHIGADRTATLPERPASGKTIRWPLYSRLVFAAKRTADGLAKGLGLNARWRQWKAKHLDAYRSVLRVNTAQADIEPKVREQLGSYFHEDIRELESITGRQLSHWT